MLKVNQVSKKFLKREVLSEVSFSIEQAEIVGIIGPNGSGKTTLLNVLIGMLEPTFGNYIVEEGVRVGMAISRKGFFSDMTVADNLRLQANLLKVNDEKGQVENAMAKLEIDFGTTMFGQLSAGMKQRVTLAAAWLCHFDLILLDEPTNHLDIDSILLMRKLVKNESQLGTSFLITSHILTDLEKICDRILFMRQGKLLGSYQKNDLIQRYGSFEEAYLVIGR